MQLRCGDYCYDCCCWAVFRAVLKQCMFICSSKPLLLDSGTRNGETLHPSCRISGNRGTATLWKHCIASTQCDMLPHILCLRRCSRIELYKKLTFDGYSSLRLWVSHGCIQWPCSVSKPGVPALCIWTKGINNSGKSLFKNTHSRRNTFR